jgi:hypothetical protein
MRWGSSEPEDADDRTRIAAAAGRLRVMTSIYTLGSLVGTAPGLPRRIAAPA